MNKDLYYNGGQALTYNPLFLFIIGNRGCGKTYWFRKWAIRDFIKTGRQFIYLRRYKEEMKGQNKANFMSPLILNNEFPDHEITIKNDEILVDGKTAGYFCSLSTAKVKKSVDYPLVDKIGFDEFIIEKSNYTYIPNEVVNLLEFYNTVDRDRDKVRLVFMSNAISIANPYFLFFNIEVSATHRYWKFKDGAIIVDYVNNEAFKEYKRNTRFGKLIKGTSYADYSIENKFLLDNPRAIGKKTGNCSHSFNIKYNNTIYGIWRSRDTLIDYISKDYDKTSLYNYAILPNDVGGKFKLCTRSNVFFKTIIKSYMNDNILYESLQIKAIFQEIFKKLM